MVQSILEHHGGTLGLASEPGRGTEVTLVFPAADAGPGAGPEGGPPPQHGR